MAHLRLLLASFLPWVLVLWGTLFASQAHASQLAVGDLSTLFGTSDLPFRLFKRRRGGDSDSDSSGSSSSGGGSSGGSSDYDDDDDDDDSSSSSSGGSSSCISEEACLRQRFGYGKYYNTGAGSAHSTEGGYTPDGSGEGPRWLVEDGAWEFQWGFEHTEGAREGDGWYYGGAIVPYPAGETSPGGIEPERIDLNNPGQGDTNNKTATTSSAVSHSPDCDFSPDMYGYKYDGLYNLSYSALELPFDEMWEMVPVYCTCRPGAVCGCDDPDPAYNFTDVLLLDIFGAFDLNYNEGNRLPNRTKGCDVFIDGEHRLLVNGTLRDGSTKADPDMERTNDTSPVGGLPCPGICGSDALGTTVPLRFVWIGGLLAGLMLV